MDARMSGRLCLREMIARDDPPVSIMAAAMKYAEMCGTALESRVATACRDAMDREFVATAAEAGRVFKPKLQKVV